MEDEHQPQKETDQVEQQVTESPTAPEPAQQEQEQEQGPDSKKSFKRFLLINLIVVGSIILVGTIFVLIMVRSSPVKSLTEENAKLRAEIKRSPVKSLTEENAKLRARIKQLQKASFGQEKESEQVRRAEELIEALQPRLGPKVVSPIAGAVVKYAQLHDLPPELILSIIHHSSGFEITAQNKEGSVGLMQISPKAYRDQLSKMKITQAEAFHIDNNILLGCMILRKSLDQGNSIETAITGLIGNDRRLNDILVGFTNTMIAEKRPARDESIPDQEPASQEAGNSLAPPSE